MSPRLSVTSPATSDTRRSAGAQQSSLGRLAGWCYDHRRKVLVAWILAIIALILFSGLGFAAHILWLGLIVAVILGVAHVLTGRRA